MSIDEMLEAVRRFRAELARFESELKRQQALEQTRAEPALMYHAPAEQWFMPAGEGCIAYGAEDAAEGKEE